MQTFFPQSTAEAQPAEASRRIIARLGQAKGKSPRARRGLIMIAVLIVIVLMSLAAYSYVDLMTARYKASDHEVQLSQAKAAAEAGIHYMMATLADPTNFESILQNNPYDNPGVLQGVLIAPHENPNFNLRFSVQAPRDDDGMSMLGPRHGVMDEAGKLNINALMIVDPTGKRLFDALMLLPNMTSDVANSIVYWVDPAATTRVAEDGTMGADNGVYAARTPPSRAANGPLSSIEELLLVEGVTPALLFGGDLNRNGIQDPNEEALDGVFDRGWFAYLTIYSRELNKDSEGNPRVDLNDADLVNLEANLTLAGLDQELIAFILVVRNYGLKAATAAAPAAAIATIDASGGITVVARTTTTTAPTAAAVPTSLSNVDIATETGGTGSKKISSFYDLIDATVEVPGTGDGAQTLAYSSPLSTGDSSSLHGLLAFLLGKTSLNADPEVLGRININTAPEAVIRTLPNLTEEDIESILSMRPELGSVDGVAETYLTPAWLLTEAGLPLATVKGLEKYVTTTTQVYRFQTLGYFEGGGPIARYEAVVDINNGMPRVLYQREISELRTRTNELGNQGP